MFSSRVICKLLYRGKMWFVFSFVTDFMSHFFFFLNIVTQCYVSQFRKCNHCSLLNGLKKNPCAKPFEGSLNILWIVEDYKIPARKPFGKPLRQTDRLFRIHSWNISWFRADLTTPNRPASSDSARPKHSAEMSTCIDMHSVLFKCVLNRWVFSPCFKTARISAAQTVRSFTPPVCAGAEKRLHAYLCLKSSRPFGSRAWMREIRFRILKKLQTSGFSV